MVLIDVSDKIQYKSTNWILLKSSRIHHYNIFCEELFCREEINSATVIHLFLCLFHQQVFFALLLQHIASFPRSQKMFHFR